MIAIDFDGTIAQYDGWQGVESVGEPIPGAIAFIKALRELGFELAIFSARAHPDHGVGGKRAIEQWVDKYGLSNDILFVTHEKLPEFDLIIDDRGITFSGDYREVLKQILKSGRG